MKWDPVGQPLWLLGRAARLFDRRVAARLRELGFSTAHVPVVRALADGSARSQTELAALARIEQPTMAEMLARMERDKLVQRSPSPVDARSTLFSLTKRALSKTGKAQRVLEQCGKEALEVLTVDEVAALGMTLQKIVDALDGSP
jgi:MarR family transcriptional regulator for hemolysin